MIGRSRRYNVELESWKIGQTLRLEGTLFQELDILQKNFLSRNGRMWTKVWLLLGREAEIPNHGDWQMEEVGPEEILMVRQKDGG